MIIIAKHHQRCCICCLGDTNIDALHEIEKRLISSSRATGKPQFRKLAREFMHLWPDKEGQTQAQKEDVLRKTLQTHVKHIAEKMQAAQEEEKEHTKTLSDMANEYLCEFYDNMMKAKGAAKTSQEFMYASNAGAPGAMLLSKLNVSDGKSANQVAESSLITSLSSKVPEAFDVQMGNSEQKATPDTNMVDEK